MGGLLGRHAPQAEPVGQFAEPLGRLLRDPGRGEVGPQGVGLGEELAQHVEIGGVGQVLKVEFVDPLGRAREIRVDLEVVQVADDQERRVAQVLPVQEELLVGGGQVLAPALVLPAEVVAFPDVGPAVAPLDLLDAALEGVRGPLGIGLGRLGLAQQVADVAEVLLAGAPLGQGGALPLGDELARGHRRPLFGGNDASLHGGPPRSDSTG